MDDPAPDPIKPGSHVPKHPILPYLRWCVIPLIGYTDQKQLQSYCEVCNRRLAPWLTNLVFRDKMVLSVCEHQKTVDNIRQRVTANQTNQISAFAELAINRK